MKVCNRCKKSVEDGNFKGILDLTKKKEPDFKDKRLLLCNTCFEKRKIYLKDQKKEIKEITVRRLNHANDLFDEDKGTTIKLHDEFVK